MFKNLQKLLDEVHTSVRNDDNKIWNFDSISYVAQLTREINTLRKHIDIQDDQLLQLQCEYDELKEEKESLDEGFETLQKAYDTLEMEHVPCTNMRRGHFLQSMDLQRRIRQLENQIESIPEKKEDTPKCQKCDKIAHCKCGTWNVCKMCYECKMGV